MTGPAALTDSQAFNSALAGQYVIDREVGRGGMGIVYLARDVKLDRPVAIKTLPPHLATDPQVRERFIREARTAGKLSHPNIVPIHRADELGGQVFFVMGYVDGESMAQQVRAEGRLHPLRVLRELTDVAHALSYAHERGVVHRDIKAENILVDRLSGRALVTDFGIARVAEAGPTTATGQILGTVYYLSPEQVNGESGDGRSDIYALGVAGFFALTGRFPFDAPVASAVLVAHVTKTAPAVGSVASDVPRALAAIIDRCLSKDPAARFQTAAELAAALAAAEPEVARDVAWRAGRPAPKVADDEAQHIWQRAAELQALTGIQPRPAPVAQARDATHDASVNTGYDLRDVRAAALEAGIASQYVEHALAEHGLPSAVPAVVPAIDVRERTANNNPLSGGPSTLEYEVVVNGEMPERDFDVMADIIRNATGEVGNSSAVGRSFTWHSMNEGRKLHATILLRNGKTTIRVTENLGPVMGGLFGGIMGGGGGGLGGITFAVGMASHNPAAAVIAWLGVILAAYGTARGVFSNISGRRDRKLAELAKALGEQARESIASRTLPP